MRTSITSIEVLIKLSHKGVAQEVSTMDQVLIFSPKFNLESKSVGFTCGFHIEKFMNKYCIPAELWNYKSYGSFSIKDPKLRPTKYESYVFMDLGDNEDEWDFIYAVLGFKNKPNKYRLEFFKFGKIDIEVSRTTNEVGEPFLKLQGNTTRIALNMIIEALRDILTWRLEVHKGTLIGDNEKYIDVDDKLDMIEQIYLNDCLYR